METVDDFADKVGEDHERHMITNFEPNTQQKLLWLAFGYKAQKMLNMLDTIEFTLEGNKYQPPKGHLNIYRDEHQILELIYGEYLRRSEEASEEREYTSSPSETEGKGEIDPKTNTTKAVNTSENTSIESRLNKEQQEFALKIASFTLGYETFQKLFSEMYITPRYEYLKKWYRENLAPGGIDRLEKAETKWLAEKIETESSEKDFNTINETHWEDNIIHIFPIRKMKRPT
ncbi:hypothetical protein JTB14_025280 [Gonioctena quinquepunctata]|nr:hypothetical protein JTB14_025280 [Gonioctena quinquepunctata]